MTDIAHDHAHIDDDGYCELHGWQVIGQVSTGNGTLAIVPPYYARTLGRLWDERVDRLSRGERMGNFEEHQLRQTTTSVSCPDGYVDSEACMLLSCDNGVYEIAARFCDPYGDGHTSICELRIDLHQHHLDEDKEIPA